MNSEQKVSDFLSLFGLKSNRFDKKALRSGKTPDYKVYKDGEMTFYCEVKHIQKDQWLDYDKANADHVIAKFGKDPTFNRLSSHIHKSAKQFNAVNNAQQYPNVLAIFNEYEQCGFLDLLAVTTGQLFAEDGENYPIYKSISEGRVKKDIENIHLFVWLDAYKPHRFLFNTVNPIFRNELCSIFAFSPEKLEMVHR